MTREEKVRPVNMRLPYCSGLRGENTRGIGSPDAAVVVGLHPFKTREHLWMEKTGHALPAQQKRLANGPLCKTVRWERQVTLAYYRLTGHHVRRAGVVLRHPTWPFMLTTVDWEVIGCAGLHVLVSAPCERGSRPWAAGVPKHVQLEAQHHMAVTGAPQVDVAALLNHGRLVVSRVSRDDDVIARLVVFESLFWESVSKNTPPTPGQSDLAARALEAFCHVAAEDSPRLTNGVETTLGPRDIRQHMAGSA